MEGWALAGTCLDLGEGLEVHVKGRVGGWWCCHDAGLMLGHVSEDVLGLTLGKLTGGKEVRLRPISRHQAGPKGSAPEFHVGLRETADPVDALRFLGGGTTQAHKQPVNRFSTAESDFRCPTTRHALTPRADDTTESYTSPSPVAAQCRVPRTQNSKGGLCLCNARSSSFVMACHSWAKGQYTRDQPSIRRHCRGGDRQPSSNVQSQTRMVTGCGRLGLGRGWPGYVPQLSEASVNGQKTVSLFQVHSSVPSPPSSSNACCVDFAVATLRLRGIDR